MAIPRRWMSRHAGSCSGRPVRITEITRHDDLELQLEKGAVCRFELGRCSPRKTNHIWRELLIGFRFSSSGSSLSNKHLADDPPAPRHPPKREIWADPS